MTTATQTAALRSLLAAVSAAIETAGHALYRSGRVAEIDALTVLSCAAASLAEEIEAAGIAGAIAPARALAAYVAPFLSSPVDAYRAGELLAVVEEAVL